MNSCTYYFRKKTRVDIAGKEIAQTGRHFLFSNSHILRFDWKEANVWSAYFKSEQQGFVFCTTWQTP